MFFSEVNGMVSIQYTINYSYFVEYSISLYQVQINYAWEFSQFFSVGSAFNLNVSCLKVAVGLFSVPFMVTFKDKNFCNFWWVWPEIAWTNY